MEMLTICSCVILFFFFFFLKHNTLSHLATQLGNEISLVAQVRVQGRAEARGGGVVTR